jgi:hypothetical protein
MSQGPGAWGQLKLEARRAFHHHASLFSSRLPLETGPFIHLLFDRRLGSIGRHSGSGTTKANLRRSELPTNHFATHFREQLWCTICREAHEGLKSYARYLTRKQVFTVPQKTASSPQPFSTSQ